MSDTKQIEEPRTRYDQVTHDTVTATPGVRQTTHHGKTTRTDKNLTSTNTLNTRKDSATKQVSTSQRVNNATTTSSRASTERANRGFTIAFSIPLTGIIPTGGTAGGQC